MVLFPENGPYKNEHKIVLFQSDEEVLGWNRISCDSRSNVRYWEVRTCLSGLFVHRRAL